MVFERLLKNVVFYSSQVFSVIDGLLSSPLCHKGM